MTKNTEIKRQDRHQQNPRTKIKPECPCRSEKHHDHTFAEPEINHEQGHLRITSTHQRLNLLGTLNRRNNGRENYIPADTFEF